MTVKIRNIDLYDNTRVASYKGCRRRYFFRHYLHLTSGRKSSKLAFGSAWHSAMDVAWEWMCNDQSGDKRADLDNLPSVVDRCMEAFVREWVEEGMVHPLEMDDETTQKLDPRIPVVAESMLYMYIAQRMDVVKDYELIEPEKPFIVPLSASEEERALWYCGRLDKLLRHKRTGKFTVIEHKTSSWYAREGGFNKNYLDSFSPNSQVDGYLYAASLMYGENNVQQLLVDAALVHKQRHDVFVFIPISRQFNNLALWHWEARYWSDLARGEVEELEAHREEYEKMPILPLFPRDTGACFDFMEACPYLDVCKMHPNPLKVLDSLHDMYVTEEWKPYDELDLQRIGVELVE